MDVRFCPKHPSERMILLFHHYWCDTCDPPTGGVSSFGAESWWKEVWEKFYPEWSVPAYQIVPDTADGLRWDNSQIILETETISLRPKVKILKFWRTLDFTEFELTTASFDTMRRKMIPTWSGLRIHLKVVIS